MNNREEVLNYLAKAALPYRLIEHEAAYTVADMDKMGDTYVYICKNLFLRDKKKRRYFLLSVQKDKRVDLKALAAAIDLPSLHFASEDDLQAILGLTKGAVSPCGLIHDLDKQVEVIVDRDLLALPEIGVHPNDNTATIWLHPKDLLDFMVITGHEPQILTI